MTSVHARRARNAYRKERTSSAQSAPNPAQPPIIYYENASNNNNLMVNGRLSSGNSAPNVQSRWPPPRRILPQRQSSLPAAPLTPAGANAYQMHLNSQLPVVQPNSGSLRHISSSCVSSASNSRLLLNSRSPIALSINEDDEENLEDVIENGNQNGGIEEEYELLPKPLNTKSRRLKRQVTICEDSMSMADSLYCLRLQSNGGGRTSKQNSLSIQSGMHHIGGCQQRASPIPLTSRPPSVSGNTTIPAANNVWKLKRQESSFTQEEIYSLQEAFAKLDLDGDGRLSRKEVEKAMGNVLSEADLNDLLSDLDTDQNGEVEWHEFLQVMKTRMREPESVKMLKEAFRVMAADSSDGVMTAEEMRRYLFSEVKTSYADHELQEMFTALDQDNDGKVKMEDFVRLLATENSVDVQDESPNCAEYCVIL